MKRFNKVIACALSVLMVINPLSVHAEEKTYAWKDDNCAISSSISSEKDIVTVQLNLSKDYGVTSGRAVIFYDENDMELQWNTSVGYWDMYDINESYEMDGRKGISYAFISTKAPHKDGTILTLCFKAKNPENGKTISVESDIIEAYAMDEGLLLGVDKQESTTQLSNIGTIQVGNVVVETGSEAEEVISRLIGIKKKIGSILKGIFG